jgi:hypothetical protein
LERLPTKEVLVSIKITMSSPSPKQVTAKTSAPSASEVAAAGGGGSEQGDSLPLQAAATAATMTETTSATSTTTTSSSSTMTCGKEELAELIRAIKFAKPEASQKEVHREITEELSQKYQEQFGFLKHVQLNDVKKVWKKALKDSSSSSTSTTTTASTTNGSSATTTTTQPQGQQRPLHGDTTTTNNNSGSNHDNRDLVEKLKQGGAGGPVKIFTVGNVTIQHLAEEYTATAVALEQAAAHQKEQEYQKLLQDYVHVYLDVPADRSGSRPHQALINFQFTAATTTTTNNKSSSSSNKSNSGGGNHSSKNKKKKNQKTASQPPPPPPPTPTQKRNDDVHDDQTDNDDQQPDGAVIQQQHYHHHHPMLLYNQNRLYKTFLHADPPNEESYHTIQQWIVKAGVGGALGQFGGTKAYFYSRISSSSSSSPSEQPAPNIISIRITELAPPQEW